MEDAKHTFHNILQLADINGDVRFIGHLNKVLDGCESEQDDEEEIVGGDRGGSGGSGTTPLEEHACEEEEDGGGIGEGGAMGHVVGDGMAGEEVSPDDVLQPLPQQLRGLSELMCWPTSPVVARSEQRKSSRWLKCVTSWRSILLPLQR
jgi:hypothetical protein